MARQPQEDRRWRITFRDNEFLNENANIAVTTTTRTLSPSYDAVPDKFFSSLIYKLQHETIGFADPNEYDDQIVVRIKVIDPDTKEEITKNKQPIIKGTTESTLVRPKNKKNTRSEMGGVLKVQFTDVSYHHNNKEFAWQLSYFAADDLQNPILVKTSPPFLVMARKPSPNDQINQIKRNLKRKGLSEEEILEISEQKMKSKLSTTTTTSSPGSPVSPTTTPTMEVTANQATVVTKKKKTTNPTANETIDTKPAAAPCAATKTAQANNNTAGSLTTFQLLQRHLEQIHDSVDSLTGEQRQEMMDFMITKLIPKLTACDMTGFYLAPQEGQVCSFSPTISELAEDEAALVVPCYGNIEDKTQNLCDGVANNPHESHDLQQSLVDLLPEIKIPGQAAVDDVTALDSSDLACLKNKLRRQVRADYFQRLLRAGYDSNDGEDDSTSYGTPATTASSTSVTEVPLSPHKTEDH